LVSSHAIIICKNGLSRSFKNIHTRIARPLQLPKFVGKFAYAQTQHAPFICLRLRHLCRALLLLLGSELSDVCTPTFGTG